MTTDVGPSLPPRWLPWVRAGWILIALTSLWVFGWTVALTRQFAASPPDRIVQGLNALGWSQTEYYWYTLLSIAPMFLAGFTMGALVFWLRPHDRMALFTSLFLMTFSAANSFSPAKEYLFLVASAPLMIKIPNIVTGMLSYGLLAVFFATFPDGRFVPRWMRWIALDGIFLALAWNFFPTVVGDFSGPFGLITLSAVSVMFGGSLYAQVWRYRHYANPLQKQQTKWFVYGFVLIVGILVIPSIPLYALDNTDPKTSVLVDSFVGIANVSFLLLPLAIGIAILRYRLWDIDIIIRRTLQYTLLTVLLALVYFGGVVVLQGLLSPLTGSAHSPVVTVITTLGIAALFNPLRNRVQGFIDRRFYRKKYNAEKTLANFAAATRDEVDMDKLAAALLGVVDETMQPERASLWVKGRK